MPPWLLRLDRYELVTEVNGSIPVFPSKPGSGTLALMMRAVSFDAMLSKREDVQDLVITAVENPFGRINTLHKPIEWLA